MPAWRPTTPLPTATFQSKENFAPGTDRIVVTICRQYAAYAAGFLPADQRYQSPLSSCPRRRIVTPPMPVATSRWATTFQYAL